MEKMKWLFLLVPMLALSQSVRPLDARLRSYDYPFPVHFFKLAEQGRELEMAYMDVAPDKPNGQTIVLLHGKNFAGNYWQRTARELLDEAWKIAPGSAEVAEAFKLRNYRRVGDDWVRDAPLATSPADAAPPAAPRPSQGLRGRTPQEVRDALATEPTSRSFVGTKGRLIEQWIFVDTRQKCYVNFLFSPGDLNPRVISDYFLPR